MDTALGMIPRTLPWALDSIEQLVSIPYTVLYRQPLCYFTLHSINLKRLSCFIWNMNVGHAYI